MMKIEKERKFKREYIPVVLGGLILILLFVLLVLTINYDGNVKKEKIENKNIISETDDLAIEKNDSKCSKDELNKLIASANKVSAEYYVDEKKTKIELTEENKDFYETLEDGYYKEKIISISIGGITNDIYVEITNDFNDTVLTIKEENLDKNGKYIFEAADINKRITYTVSIYSNNPSCSNELLRKTAFKTKIFNNFSLSMACVTYPNYENCVELVDKEIDAMTFTKKYEEYQQKNDPNQDKANIAIIKAMAAKEGADEKQLDEIEENIKGEKNKKENSILAKWKENKELIIISIVIIAIGILIVILLMFIRRNKL